MTASIISIQSSARAMVHGLDIVISTGESGYEMLVRQAIVKEAIKYAGEIGFVPEQCRVQMTKSLAYLNAEEQEVFILHFVTGDRK